MLIKFNVELSDDELKAIAGYACEDQSDYDDVRRFLRAAIRDAVEDAMVGYELAMRCPITRTGRYLRQDDLRQDAH